MSNPYSDIQLFAREQEVVNLQHDLAVENLSAISEYLQTVSEEDKKIINEFLTAKVPGYSEELLTGMVLGQALSEGRRYFKLREKHYNAAKTILDIPEPKLDPEKFGSKIGSRRTATHSAISTVITKLPSLISRTKTLGNVNKPSTFDYTAYKKLGRDCFAKGVYSDMSDSERQKTADTVAGSIQLVGSLILAGATYVTLGWFGFYSFIDDVIVGSWTWLVGLIKNGIWKRIERREDEVAAMTATKLGYSPDNVKKLRADLISIRSQLKSMEKNLGFPDNIDEFIKNLRNKYINSEGETELDYEEQLDVAEKMLDICSSINSIWFGCCVAYAAIVDLTKE